MKVLLVARKHLTEILRELQLLFLELLLPLLFLGITAATYNARLLVTHPVLVSGPDPAGAPLLEALQAGHYADGRPVFEVTLTEDPVAAEAALEDRSATAWVVLSGSEGALEGEQPPTDGFGADGYPLPARVTIRGDALYPRFHRASTILTSAVYRYADRVSGRPEVVGTVTQPLAAGEPETEFDLYAPGMMMMALLMLIPQTAMLVGREIRWHTLRRLRLTRLRAWELLAGVSLAQLAVAVVQVLVMFLAALLMGFHNQGSLALALTVGLVVSLSAIGQGLIVACFVENDSQAANVGSTLTMLEVFVSGSFFQLPPLTLFTLAGHQIDLFDVFPATHGFMALQQVLSYGFGLREITFRLGATLLLSALYFLAGVAVFRRLQMRDRL
jgi:ABC-type multidrug transport system permease subunit